MKKLENIHGIVKKIENILIDVMLKKISVETVFSKKIEEKNVIQMNEKYFHYHYIKRIILMHKLKVQMGKLHQLIDTMYLNKTENNM
jgi:hypothetical protein